MFKISTLLLMLFAAPAAAQSAPMVILADCASISAVRQYVEEAKEIPFVGGPGMMQRDDQEFAEGVWKIYMNPQTETYSIVIEFPWDNVSCLVGIGAELAPFQEQGSL